MIVTSADAPTGILIEEEVVRLAVKQLTYDDLGKRVRVMANPDSNEVEGVLSYYQVRKRSVEVTVAHNRDPVVYTSVVLAPDGEIEVVNGRF